MDKKNRIELPLREAKVRNKDFNEVAIGYSDQQAKEEADRCLNCKNAACVQGCPVGVPIPSFISAIKEGDIQKAYKLIKSTNSLPAVCGRVCPQEEQCEKNCIRNKIDMPVAIGTLERYVADTALNFGFSDSEEIVKNGKKVAIIGSGPSGITCAGDLAKAGFEVTIFEAFHKAGGVLIYGIPEFRLPKDLVKKELDNLIALGVNICLDTVVGKTIMLSDLIEDYDAVFIGTGAGLPAFQGIEGENLNGVFSANEYLTRVNLMGAYKKDSTTPIMVEKKVVVVGAGNVAMDAARTALRIGAKEVSILYRRSRAEMPARAEEIKHAEEEGIIFRLLTNPIKIVGEKSVNKIICQQMVLGEPDASGRRRPVAVEGSDFDLECDQVIMALGTSPNPLLKSSCKDLAVGKKGTIIINDETGETSIEGVYAGGDAVTGSATVILAMGAGKKAAKSIIEKYGK